MGAIANLGVSLSARTGNFRKGMKGASSSLQRFKRSVASIAGQMAKFGLALGAAGAGGLALLTRQAFKSMDSISKLSDSLGIATEDLVALQHAGEITGVGTEQMNKSLKKFVINIGEAQTGTSEALDTLEQLGLTADQLAVAGPAEAFKLVAEEINKLPDVTARAEASYRLFGRAGVALTNTLALGREGIEQMAADAENLGLTFDRVSGAKIEAANDAFTRVKEVFVGVGRAIAVELAPFVEALSTSFRSVATAGEGVGAKVVNAFNFVLTSIGKVADWLELLKAGFYALRATANVALLGIVGSLNFVAQEVGKFLDWLGVDAAEGFLSVLDATVKDFTTDIEEDFKAAGDAMANFLGEKNAKAVHVAFQGIREDAQKTAEAVANAVQGRVTPDVAGIRAATQSVAATRTAAKQATFKQVDLSQVFLSGIQASKRQVQKVEDLKGTKAIVTAVGKVERKIGSGVAVMGA